MKHTTILTKWKINMSVIGLSSHIIFCTPSNSRASSRRNPDKTAPSRNYHAKSFGSLDKCRMSQAIPIGVRHLTNKGLILPNEDQTLKKPPKKNLNSGLQKCRNSNLPNPIFQGANLALPRHPSIPSHPDALPKATDKTPWHPQRFPGSNVWMCAICVWTYRVKECQRCFPKSMHFRCV